MAIFDKFTIDNHETLFLAHGFEKSEEQHDYECEYCNDTHYADVFYKNGKRYYFNIELKEVIKLGIPD